jgi:carbamate kinase
MGADRSRVEAVCGAIADMVADGWRVVVTHGNGPQVGAALLRSEAAPPEVYPLALDVCVASTQGEIGFLLQPALAEALEAKGLRRPVATLLTQVVVDQSDPAFAHPTKPIGPHYSRSEAAVRQARGWVVIEQPHGWRRVVPSPEPVAIVEEGVIRAMVDAGVLVVALGGGGIPVVRQGRRFVGVEAVIDKDLSSALLATRLRMDRLALVTNVDRAYLEFGAPTARGLDGVTAEDLQRHAGEGHFAPGSMSPKVDAALRFVRAGGGESIVTSYEELAQALQGRAGTRVRLASHPAAGPHDRPGVQQVDR